MESGVLTNPSHFFLEGAQLAAHHGLDKIHYGILASRHQQHLLLARLNAGCRVPELVRALDRLLEADFSKMKRSVRDLFREEGEFIDWEPQPDLTYCVMRGLEVWWMVGGEGGCLVHAESAEHAKLLCQTLLASKRYPQQRFLLSQFQAMPETEWKALQRANAA